MTPTSIPINRAPVLTLWAYVVARRLGFHQAESLTLAKALAGATAHSKGTRIGVFEPTPAAIKEARAKRREEAGVVAVSFMTRELPMMQTDEGLVAMAGDKPIDPAAVDRYLDSKFGEARAATTEAMEGLAKAYPPKALAAEAFRLYMQFRPEVAAGKKGWALRASSRWIYYARWQAVSDRPIGDEPRAATRVDRFAPARRAPRGTDRFDRGHCHGDPIRTALPEHASPAVPT